MASEFERPSEVVGVGGLPHGCGWIRSATPCPINERSPGGAQRLTGPGRASSLRSHAPAPQIVQHPTVVEHNEALIEPVVEGFWTLQDIATPVLNCVENLPS